MRKRISAIINKLNISIMMMTVVLMIGCGQQPAGKTGAAGGANGNLGNSLMELGRSVENAFYSFMALVSDTLGLRVTKDTKKSEVAGYFNSLGEKLGEVSGELEQVAVKATADADKDGLLNKTIREAVNTAKKTLEVLKGHLESLNDIGDANKVVDVTSNQQGVAANTDALKKVYQALKGIVTAATTEGVAEPKRNNVAISTANVGGTDAKNGAKVLATGAAGAAAGLEAAAIVSSVSGEEILAAIVKSGEGDAEVGAAATADTSALSFARGGQAANLAQDVALASAVSGGIVLRSLVKDGKLASHNANSDEKAVQSAGITAVNKLLVAIEDVIKKTVKNVLGTAKEKIDKARGLQEPVSESSNKAD
ncbi:variable large family protein [Borrelia hermsii]|uniref:Variable large protein n=1 Tax=Borrelia hermsii MTW TaxID=1313291 RepID=W5T6Y3_BORHE|nr:variable large family protein [Borrelia hermsii]AHH14723.1 Variable major outer membrane lipoprotein [Borrelia hermsii MTW]